MLAIEEAISRVPFLVNAKGLNITKLAGGITNFNYRVDFDGQSCVLRIPGTDTNLLGIQRDVEYIANLEAGRLGIAPEVLFFVQPEGYLVTRFVKGDKIPPEEMVKTENIRRVVEKVHKYHEESCSLPGEFNVFRRIERLLSVSKRNQCIFPADFNWLIQKMYEIENTLLKDPYIPTPCHDDLLNLNFLDESGDLKILDWEYAGMGDIFFDLANFSHHHQLTDDQEMIELQVYFGHVTLKIFARFKLMKPMSEIHEAMWGTTQTGISSLRNDFQGYADYWFKRAKSDLLDSRYNCWLRDVLES